VIMAGGAVVAAGTAQEIIGTSQAVVVLAQSWADAFGRLEDAGLPVSLAGRGVRVPGARSEDVQRALGDLPAVVQDVPATLEERFFELVQGS
jgi:ABC-2 type transport system ATP-binding protein